MITLSDQILLSNILPLDPRTTNVVLSGGFIKVETQEEYLSRVPLLNRYLGLDVVLLSPAGDYSISSFLNFIDLGYYSFNIYRFTNNLDDLQIVKGNDAVVNNLESDSTTDSLSAAMGKELKRLITEHESNSNVHFLQEEIVITPQQVSNLDAYIASNESDPVFTSSPAYSITNENITNWNSKADSNHTHTGVYEPANANIQTHISSTSNPHNVTKTQVGLGNVLNVDTTNPSNITQDSTHRFVSDTEKNTWNGKQEVLGFTPENIANKVSAFQTVPDNTHYPSEKLVKDSLDGKQPIGNYAPALGADDNYVTDAEKAALHAHSNKTALDAVSGTNTGDNATNTTSNSYADGKVEDAIVNGITTKAPSQNAVFDALGTKQETLVSGTNIKTINNQSILGSGNINIAGAGGDVAGPSSSVDGDVVLFDGITGKLIKDSGKTIVTTLGSGDLTIPTSKAVKDVTDTKVTANAAITGATKTKITYDSKGLVTSGEDATTADIADSTNKRYVTDTQLVVIGNTSGTNTGDSAGHTGLVPYTGATTDTDLGTHAIKAAKFQLNTGATNTLTTGEIGWNSHDKTPEVKLNNSVTLQLGQEVNLPLQNNTGGTLLNGRLVRIVGHDLGSEYYTVNYSDASTEATAFIDYMLTEDILDGGVGFGTKVGIVHDINTLGGTIGAPAYLGTNGQFTATPPSYPNKVVVIGFYGHISATVGEMLVNFSRTTQYSINTLSNGLELKMTQNPGIDQTQPILASDIVIDTTALTLTIATVNGGQAISAANPIRFFTDGGGIINKWEKTSPVTFPAFTNTTGVWIFYFDNSGNPITTQGVFPNFNLIATVYRIYWNANLSGAERLVVETIETHLNDISATDHAWKHAQGSIYELGLEITYNALPTGAPNADGRNTCISLSTGTCSDDGLNWTVTNTTTPTNYFEQDLGQTVAASLNSTNSGLFKIRSSGVSGSLIALPATRFPFLWNPVNNRPQYITTAGVATDVIDDRWFVYYIYNIGDRRPGNAIKIASAETDFTSLALAQAHNWEVIRALYASIKDNEIRPLYKIIFFTNYTNPAPYDVACKYTVIREVYDIRTLKTTTSTATAGSSLASNVIYSPTGTLTSTNVQSAISELESTKEPAFSKNTAFNKNFGTTVGTVAEGNDSRIVDAYAGRITTFTTTGNSGAATFSSNILNIPNYTLAGLGGISLTSLSSASTELTYTNTTGVFSVTTGYAIPSTSSISNWNTAYDKRISSVGLTTSTLTVTLADASTVTTSVPTWNQNTSGSAGSVANSLIIKSDSGTTEGTDLYTFNGSASKTINFLSGTNVTLTEAAGSITFSSPSLSLGATVGAGNAVTDISVSNHQITMTKGSTFLTSNQTITLGGILSGSGTTSITAAAASGYYMPSTTDQTNWDAKQSALNGTGFVKISGTTISYDNSTYLLSSAYTAADVLSKLLTVDGTTSGLDADLLDGQHGSYYQVALLSGTNIKTINGSSILGSGDLVITASSHTHGNITNEGAIGTTANLPIITTTSGVLTTGSFGSAANTFCQGNDSRLSDTRNTTNAVTFSNSGSGDVSGTTFNGSATKTISYNTIGAIPNVVSDTAPNLGGNLIVNQKNIDVSATLSTNSSYSGIIESGTVGESVVFGDVLYLKFSDGKWWKAKANSYTTTPAVRMAMATISANASGVLLIEGNVRYDSWSLAANKVYLSAATAGAVTTTQPSTTGNQIQVIGIAKTSTKMYFRPSYDVGEK